MARAISESYDAFSDHITSYTIQQNATWPFFTIPDIQRHGSNVRRQTLSLGIIVIHLVAQDERKDWEAYTLDHNYLNTSILPFIHDFTPDLQPVPSNPVGPWGPIWEVDPPPLFPILNHDFLPRAPQAPIIEKLQHAIYGRSVDSSESFNVFPDEFNSRSKVHPQEPFTTYFSPLYDTFDRHGARMVGTMSGVLRWGLFFTDLLPAAINGIDIVLDSSCNQTFTWRILGQDASFRGNGDEHETDYNQYEYSAIFGSYDDPQAVVAAGACIVTVRVYPSRHLEDQHITHRPVYFSVTVGSIFVLVTLSFLAFDYFQTQRNNKVIESAAKTSAVVNSVFPAEFRDRILQQSEGKDRANTGTDKYNKKTFFASHNQRIRKFLDGTEDALDVKSKPLAELFPEVTIMFADIVGFTAWCSVREPTQVFMLLETLYAVYDDLAKKRSVFKVESVGDCYVAAAGLPDKRPDHALVMARYSHTCLQATSALMGRLEAQLGPDTGDLTIRIGLHSGPVTAGVLRGERARFQLFGDTMNMAARIENTGSPGRIHLSEDTANLLKAASKSHWLQIRTDKVDIKGKGSTQTYWLSPQLPGGVRNRSSFCGSDDSRRGDLTPEAADEELLFAKRERLVEWHVDVFSNLLRQIEARRRAVKKVQEENKNTNIRTGHSQVLNGQQKTTTMSSILHDGASCLDEVKEIIMLPKFSNSTAKYQCDPSSIQLDQPVLMQLRNYIRTISLMYRDNAFHNFEHASHVTMSVNKLLARIVMPSDLLYEGDELTNEQNVKTQIASTLHDHTYGITSDPLTQFAVVFSALIHDVDHTGVPNTQLINENPQLAAVFKNKSIAEQNSIVLSWDLLNDQAFGELRHAIAASDEEQARFRQLVVQTVLATDIADKELKVLRNARWEKAFHEPKDGEAADITINRKATIVIEHLIQASDVAHTMQHWHIYRKWNENFFNECYQAFLDGRSDTDPSVNWYIGEIGFFDFYILPLAKKLKDCGVFGVSSDEYLNYASRNRKEWEERGNEVVAEMLEAIQRRKQK